MLSREAAKHHTYTAELRFREGPLVFVVYQLDKPAKEQEMGLCFYSIM